jgi:hypothetical protein
MTYFLKLFVFLLLVVFSGISLKSQSIELDSIIQSFDRKCDCNSYKDSSEKAYVNCLESELDNPFFHRTDYLLFSNYWVNTDEKKSYDYALQYFSLGGYFSSGVDSSLLKKHILISKKEENYFNKLYELSLSNEQKRDSLQKTNGRLVKAIIELKPYDQFFRGNKKQNLKVLNDSSLESSSWKIQIQLDSFNRALLSAILDSSWITIDNYGNEANKVAWLIAQHADLDLEFQENCLKLMLAAYPEDRTSNGMYMAYLIDRLSINRHGYQYFGTQFTFQDGAIDPKPIKNPELVNKRREMVFLPALEKYLEGSKSYLDKKEKP